ncbi:(5-formylfuran-3-yl)methyl phosphate synthase [Methylopila musalis]|uniref:(5-formylfuran-3-yl)methyl phosphate synthase n=1 Tax=Methylopila musalis TaxID=1134781 RepID=A0ABW3Z8S8_9HYPH
MTGFLASVATLDEMALARAAGADIVDLKNPAEGALGAWALADLRAAVALWRGWGEDAPLLSATIGDRPMVPETVRAAADAVAETGVPLVKLGVFRGGDAGACFEALRPLGRRVKLIAVFFADQGVDRDLVEHAASAGFHGAMIDTADKAAGGLRRHIHTPALGRFVREAKALGLLTGLAGSLRLADVDDLAELGPDYLGFRGALCDGGRTGAFSTEAAQSLRAALNAKRAA